MEQEIATLTEALAQEIKRREGAEEEAGEFGKRRSELEAELAKHKEAQARLRRQLEEVQRSVQSLQENYTNGQSKLEERAKELQAAQPVEEKINSLTEAPRLRNQATGNSRTDGVQSFKQRRVGGSIGEAPRD